MGQECQACATKDHALALLLYMVGVLVMGCIFAYYIHDGVTSSAQIADTRGGIREDSVDGNRMYMTIMIKLCTNFLQISSMVGLYNISLPASLSGFFTVQREASNPVHFMINLDCLQWDTEFDLFASKLVAIAIAPVLVLAMSGLTILGLVILRKLHMKSVREIFMSSFIVAMQLMYPTLVGQGMLSFDCRNTAGRRLLKQALDVECWRDARHVTLSLALSVPVLVLFGALYPSLLGSFIYQKRQYFDGTDVSMADKRFKGPRILFEGIDLPLRFGVVDHAAKGMHSARHCVTRVWGADWGHFSFSYHTLLANKVRSILYGRI